MIKAAKVLADTLSEIDADHAKDYAKNYESLEKELTKLDEELHEKYDSVTREKAFITSHTAFAYLAKTYDLHQIGIAGIDPENEPSNSWGSVLFRAAPSRKCPVVSVSAS